MHLTNPALQASPRSPEDQTEELRVLLSTIPTLVWRTSPEGSAEFFNQRWFEYTGLSFEEAQGSGWMSAFHPDDLETLARRWGEIVASRRPGEVEARFRRHDGEYRWHLMRSEPLFDEDLRVVSWCGTNTDIEDIKRVENELRRNKILLDHAQRLSRTGGVGLRLSSGEIFWSEETSRIYGYPPEVSPTKELVLERVHPEDVGLLEGIFDRAMQGGAAFDFEHRLLMPDGSIKYLRNLANAVMDPSGHEEILGAIMDVSEQYHARAALTEALARIGESEDALRKTIDTIPALAWSSPENGLGEFFSKRWLDYTGLTHEQARGAGWIVAIHPDDVDMLAETWTRIRATGKEGGLEARLRRFDGVYRWFLFRAAPLKDPEGEDIVWYGTNTDIDDLKRAEAELLQREADLRKAQAELAHVTRVTTLGELAASIAHEVSQPIAGVVLNANASLRWLSHLNGETEAIQGAHDALNRIIRDGTRAGDVIARIRALFKKTEMAKESLDLNELIQEVISLSRIEIDKKRVALRLGMAPDLPNVLGDRVQIQQVVINLILNGIEAMSDIYTLRELVIQTQRHGDAQARITIRDSGVGFSSANIEQFFTAFHSTKPNGLGMGLSISRSIVEGHGGRLWAEANPDNAGAQFHFTLPAI